MELSYIWDTNIVIYYFQKQFPPVGEKFVDDLLVETKPKISIITEIELLCWKLATNADIMMLKIFISDAIVYQLDRSIKKETIEIRKMYKLNLPDAIIAASALVNNQILITRNTSDFSKVPELKIVNPFQLIKQWFENCIGKLAISFN